MAATTTIEQAEHNVQLGRQERGFFDLRLGQPDPRLLPAAEFQQASLKVFGSADAAEGLGLGLGGQALCYGAAMGPRYLTSWIEGHVEKIEPDARLSEGETVVTAGNSDAVDQICTLFTQRGDAVLVESPTYFLMTKVFEDHQLRIVPVPVHDHDEDGEDEGEGGLQVKRIEGLFESVVKETGKAPRFLYTIPTYHNPLGHCMSLEARLRLIDVAQRHDLLLVEDDVYRELYFNDDQPPPPSLFALAPRGLVLRLSTFSKTVAPGVRLGWVNGSREHCKRFGLSGLRESGGGVSHMTAMIVANLCHAGHFDEQVQRLRRVYRARRDALATGLRQFAPSCSFRLCEGGFFIWLRLPRESQITAQQLQLKAVELGVNFLSGSTCHLEPDRGLKAIRLAFSMYDENDLMAAARILGSAIDALLLLQPTASS